MAIEVIKGSNDVSEMDVTWFARKFEQHYVTRRCRIKENEQFMQMKNLKGKNIFLFIFFVVSFSYLYFL